MGQQILDRMLPALQRMTWPDNEAATELGRITYYEGLEQVDEFRGDSRKMAGALRTFQTSDSRPYAFAGVAYALVAAAQENDGGYAQSGLDEAMAWLEKAQEMEPDRLDINFIEAFIYIYGGRLEDARLVLDFLNGQEPGNYFVATAEIAYWEAQGDVAQISAAFDRGITAADTVPQRLRLQSRKADFYHHCGLLDEAMAAYKQARHFDAQNAELIHNMSLVAWKMEDFDYAERLNQQALAIREFPAARKLAEVIEARKKDEGGRFMGLFGRK